MKRFASVVVALGLATAGSTALATQPQDQVNAQASKPQPVKMTDAQMDNVAGGALLNLFLVDVADVNNNRVAVPVQVGAAVSAAVAVLGTAVAAPAGTSIGSQRVSQP